MNSTGRTIILFCLLLASVNTHAQQSDPLKPQKTNDGIIVGTASHFLDTALVNRLFNDIDAGNYIHIHSLLILKNNELLVEKYFEEYDRDRLHSIRSVSKSVTALLLGIAIDKGYIKSVDEGIFNYLPNYQHLKNDLNEEITLHHLASMSSGLEWREAGISYNDESNDENRMYEDGDWVDYTLRKEMIARPGEVFNYNGGVTNVLAAAIQEAVNMPLDQFAEEHLFTPLGINNYIWRKNRDSTLVSANAGLRITPRDMIKIGTMLLNKGEWNGKRILSQEWVKKLSSTQIEGGPLGPFTLGYGYKVLVVEKGPDFFPGLKGYAATGNGGQIIWVLPEHNTVFVMTGGNYNSDLSQTQPIEMVIKYLYPSLKKGAN